jgi:hypothetical protein
MDGGYEGIESAPATVTLTVLGGIFSAFSSFSLLLFDRVVLRSVSVELPRPDTMVGVCVSFFCFGGSVPSFLDKLMYASLIAGLYYYLGDYLIMVSTLIRL